MTCKVQPTSQETSWALRAHRILTPDHPERRENRCLQARTFVEPAIHRFMNSHCMRCPYPAGVAETIKVFPVTLQALWCAKPSGPFLKAKLNTGNLMEPDPGSMQDFPLFKPPGKNEKICPVVKSIPAKTKKEKSKMEEEDRLWKWKKRIMCFKG